MDKFYKPPVPRFLLRRHSRLLMRAKQLLRARHIYCRADFRDVLRELSTQPLEANLNFCKIRVGRAKLAPAAIVVRLLQA